MTKLIASLTAALMTLVIFTSLTEKSRLFEEFTFFPSFTATPAIEFNEEDEEEGRVRVVENKDEVKIRLKFVDFILSIFQDN